MNQDKSTKPKAPKAAKAAKAPKATKAPKGVQKKTSAARPKPSSGKKAFVPKQRLTTPRYEIKKVQEKYKRVLVVQNKAIDKLWKEHVYQMEEQHEVFKAQVDFLQEQVSILCEHDSRKKVVLARVEAYAERVAKKLMEMEQDHIGRPTSMSIPYMENEEEDMDDGHNVSHDDEDDEDDEDDDCEEEDCGHGPCNSDDGADLFD